MLLRMSVLNIIRSKYLKQGSLSLADVRTILRDYYIRDTSIIVRFYENYLSVDIDGDHLLEVGNNWISFETQIIDIENPRNKLLEDSLIKTNPSPEDIIYVIERFLSK